MHPLHDGLRIASTLPSYRCRTFALADLVQSEQAFTGARMGGLERLHSQTFGALLSA